MKAASRKRWTGGLLMAVIAVLCGGCGGLQVRVVDSPPIMGRYVNAGERITLDITVRNVADCNLTGFPVPGVGPSVGLYVFPFIDADQEVNAACSGQLSPGFRDQAMNSLATLQSQAQVLSQSMVQMADSSILCIPGSYGPFEDLLCVIPIPVPFANRASVQASIEVTAPRSGFFRTLVAAGTHTDDGSQCIEVVQNTSDNATGWACDQLAQTAPAASHSGMIGLALALAAIGLAALGGAARVHRTRAGK